MWRAGICFLHLSSPIVAWAGAAAAAAAAAQSADYSRSRDAARCCFRRGFIHPDERGSPHSLDRARTERIWLAEVGPYAWQPSMSLPVLDQINSNAPVPSRHRQPHGAWRGRRRIAPARVVAQHRPQHDQQLSGQGGRGGPRDSKVGRCPPAAERRSVMLPQASTIPQPEERRW
jgi:hypothetical protein